MRQRVVVMSLEDLKKIKNHKKRRKAHIFKINKKRSRFVRFSDQTDCESI